MLERVEACAAQRKDLHALEWENRRRCDEVRELQQARLCAVPVPESDKFAFHATNSGQRAALQQAEYQGDSRRRALSARLQAPERASKSCDSLPATT